MYIIPQEIPDLNPLKELAAAAAIALKSEAEASRQVIHREAKPCNS